MGFWTCSGFASANWRDDIVSPQFSGKRFDGRWRCCSVGRRQIRFPRETDFFAENSYFFRGLDPNFNLRGTDVEDFQFNIIPDQNGFPSTPSYD